MHVRFCLPLSIGVTLSIFPVSTHIFHILTFNIPILFTPIPQISSSVPSIPLDTQHFLKPFTVTSSEMCCHAVLIHIDWIIHVYFSVHKITWTNEEDSQFSPWILLVVLRILNTYVVVFCVVSVVWSVWVHGFFFNLWIGPGFIFESCG